MQHLGKAHFAASVVDLSRLLGPKSELITRSLEEQETYGAVGWRRRELTVVRANTSVI